MVETEVNAFNTLSIATWEEAKSGRPNESHELANSDPSIKSPQETMFISWHLMFAINTGTSGFAQPKGIVQIPCS